MDAQKQVIIHKHSLSLGTKLMLLAAIVALALNLLVPLMRERMARAQFPGNGPAFPTQIGMQCFGTADPLYMKCDGQFR
jgi:hypothetical protein